VLPTRNDFKSKLCLAKNLFSYLYVVNTIPKYLVHCTIPKYRSHGHMVGGKNIEFGWKIPTMVHCYSF